MSLSGDLRFSCQGGAADRGASARPDRALVSYSLRNGSAVLRRRNAYSLIELLIVLLVLGVLAGVAAPRYQAALAWQRLEAAGRRVAADLRRARNEAARQSTPIEVAFFVDEDRYTIAGLADLNHADQRYEQRLADAEDNVRIVRADFSGDASVTFDIYGRAGSGGVVVLGHGGEERRLTVSERGEVTQP